MLGIFSPGIRHPVLPVSVCEGDSVWLEAGAGYASYWWSNGQIGPMLQVDAPGKYFVVVENENGCKAIESMYTVSRKQDQAPGIRCASSNTICKGDSLVLTATGGSDFFWSTGNRGASLPLSEAGVYRVGAIGVCSQDTFYSTPFQVNVLDAQEPVVQNIAVGIGGTAVLVAEGENCRWYDQPAGGALLATGDTLIRTMATNNAVYYVESWQSFPPELQTGGKKDTLGGGGKSQQGGFLYFNAYQPFQLVSVKVYVPPGAPQGVRFVQLYSDTLLAYKQFQVSQGENLLQLNFDVPVGAFSLRCPQGNLYRNDGGVNYPYPIGDAGAITGSSFGDQYYYYFYDWIIEKPGLTCVSERVPVAVVVSDASGPSAPQRLKIAPNPAGNTVTVQFPEACSATALLVLSDLLGKTVLERKLSCSNAFELNLNEIASGVYVLTLCTDEQKHIGKLVIRKE